MRRLFRNRLFSKVANYICLAVMVISPLNVTAAAADDAPPIVLTINAQYGSSGTPVKVAEYTSTELASLATTYTTGEYPGFLMKGTSWSVFGIQSGIELEDLFSHAGVKNWESGSHLEFTCADGPYTKHMPTYDELAEDLKFFPATTSVETATAGAVEAPAMLGLSFGTAAIPEGQTAGQMLETISANLQSPRFFQGVTEANYIAGEAAGRRFPSGVLTITVVSPEPEKPGLTIRVKQGDAEPVMVKSYTGKELAELTETFEDKQGYLMNKSGTWSVHAVDTGVEIGALLADAGVPNWKAESHLEFTCYDGPYTKFKPTFEQLQETRNFYPATSASSTDTAGAVKVPAVIATTFGETAIATGDTAGAALAAVTVADSNPRFFVGMNEADYVAGNAPGNRFPTGIEEITVVSPEPDEPPKELEFIEFSGVNRFETAILSAKSAYPDGANGVVIATGMDFPDALASSALAGALDYPILLAPKAPAALGQSTIDAIKALKAKEVVLIGGTNSISAAAANSAKVAVGKEPIRIAGSDRYGTARAIHEYGKRNSLWSTGDVIVASGLNYPDGLSIAPYAAATKTPVLLSGPKGLDGQTLAIAKTAQKQYLIGGDVAVPVSVGTQLGATAQRIAGTNRFETSLEVARWSVGKGALKWDGVGVATGRDFPDALTGGAVQGKAGSVLLLAAYPNGMAAVDGLAKVATANPGSIKRVTYYGGLNALPLAMRSAVKAAVGG